jgi:hypothetical protein
MRRSGCRSPHQGGLLLRTVGTLRCLKKAGCFAVSESSGGGLWPWRQGSAEPNGRPIGDGGNSWDQPYKRPTLDVFTKRISVQLRPSRNLGIWRTRCNLRRLVRQRSECISLRAIILSYESLGGIYDCHGLLESPQLPLSQSDGLERGTSARLPKGAPKRVLLQHAYRSISRALTRFRNRRMISITQRIRKIAKLDGFRRRVEAESLRTWRIS